MGESAAQPVVGVADAISLSLYPGSAHPRRYLFSIRDALVQFGSRARPLPALSTPRLPTSLHQDLVQLVLRPRSFPILGFLLPDLGLLNVVGRLLQMLASDLEHRKIPAGGGMRSSTCVGHRESRVRDQVLTFLVSKTKYGGSGVCSDRCDMLFWLRAIRG